MLHSIIEKDHDVMPPSIIIPSLPNAIYYFSYKTKIILDGNLNNSNNLHHETNSILSTSSYSSYMLYLQPKPLTISNIVVSVRGNSRVKIQLIRREKNWGMARERDEGI